MSTNTAPAPLDGLSTRRVDLDAAHSYELTLFRPAGVLLHITERGHDAAIQLTPIHIVELRAELATVLISLGHGAPTNNNVVRSPAGVSILEHLRQAFEALTELDKHAPHEVDAIAHVIVAHVRSWRPFAMTEVVGG